MRISRKDLETQVMNLNRSIKRPHGLHRWTPDKETRNEFFTGEMKPGNNGVEYLSCDHVFTGLSYTTRELYLALLMANDLIRYHKLQPVTITDAPTK